MHISSATHQVTLALFDSRLTSLRLPVLRVRSTYVYAQETDEDEDPGVRREPVLPLVRHYFHAMASFEMGEPT
jgi:hypothetical protein